MNFMVFFLLDKHNFHQHQKVPAGCYAVYCTIARGMLHGLVAELTRHNGWQREVNICWELCNTASSYGSEILILHPENHESSKSIRMLKKGPVLFFFLVIWSFEEALCHILSIFLKMWPRGALHQKWLMWNQGWLCSHLKRQQSFIFASEYNNNNDLHMMLESWACKKDIKDHYSSNTVLRVGTTEHGRWQILRQLQFAIRLAGGVEGWGNRNKRMGKMSKGE